MHGGLKLNSKIWIGKRELKLKVLMAQGQQESVYLAKDTKSEERFTLFLFDCRDKDEGHECEKLVGLLKKMKSKFAPKLIFADYSVVSSNITCYHFLYELAPTTLQLEYDAYLDSEERMSESRILDIFEDILNMVIILHNKANPLFLLKLAMDKILHTKTGLYKIADLKDGIENPIQNIAALSSSDQNSLAAKITKNISLGYRAPELVLFLSHRGTLPKTSLLPTVDVWQLGCLLYQLLFYEGPFEGDNDQAILMNINNLNYTYPNRSDWVEREKERIKRSQLIKQNMSQYIHKGKQAHLTMIKQLLTYFSDNPPPSSQAAAAPPVQLLSLGPCRSPFASDKTPALTQGLRQPFDIRLLSLIDTMLRPNPKDRATALQVMYELCAIRGKSYPTGWPMPPPIAVWRGTPKHQVVFGTHIKLTNTSSPQKSLTQTVSARTTASYMDGSGKGILGNSKSTTIGSGGGGGGESFMNESLFNKTTTTVNTTTTTRALAAKSTKYLAYEDEYEDEEEEEEEEEEEQEKGEEDDDISSEGITRKKKKKHHHKHSSSSLHTKSSGGTHNKHHKHKHKHKHKKGKEEEEEDNDDEIEEEEGGSTKSKKKKKDKGKADDDKEEENKSKGKDGKEKEKDKDKDKEKDKEKKKDKEKEKKKEDEDEDAERDTVKSKDKNRKKENEKEKEKGKEKGDDDGDGGCAVALAEALAALRAAEADNRILRAQLDQERRERENLTARATDREQELLAENVGLRGQIVRREEQLSSREEELQKVIVENELYKKNSSLTTSSKGGVDEKDILSREVAVRRKEELYRSRETEMEMKMDTIRRMESEFRMKREQALKDGEERRRLQDMVRVEMDEREKDIKQREKAAQQRENRLSELEQRVNTESSRVRSIVRAIEQREHSKGGKGGGSDDLDSLSALSASLGLGIGTGTGGSGGGTGTAAGEAALSAKEAQLAARENGIAEREKGLSRREAATVSREDDLEHARTRVARRDLDLQQREDDLHTRDIALNKRELEFEDRRKRIEEIIQRYSRVKTRLGQPLPPEPAGSFDSTTTTTAASRARLDRTGFGSGEKASKKDPDSDAISDDSASDSDRDSKHNSKHKKNPKNVRSPHPPKGTKSNKLFDESDANDSDSDSN